jgi:hypothetical protein
MTADTSSTKHEVFARIAPNSLHEYLWIDARSVVNEAWVWMNGSPRPAQGNERDQGFPDA